MAKSKDSLTTVVSESLKKSFNIDAFKKSKFLDQSVKFKPQRWIKLSEAFQNVISLPGIPMGHISLLRGHSDTGKTTAMLEAAVAAQKMGVLPVFIITEMKWNWEHAQQMGFEMEPVVDTETGEIVDPKKIPNTDIVFRITAWDHVPMAPKKITKAEAKAKRRRLEDILDLDDAVEEEDPLADLLDLPVLSLNHVRQVAVVLITKCCVVLNGCGQVTVTMRSNDNLFSGARQW